MVGPEDYEPRRSGRKRAAPQKLQGESLAPKKGRKGPKKTTPVAPTARPTEPTTSPVVKGIKRVRSSSAYILARKAAKSGRPEVKQAQGLTRHYNRHTAC